MAQSLMVCRGQLASLMLSQRLLRGLLFRAARFTLDQAPSLYTVTQCHEILAAAAKESLLEELTSDKDLTPCLS